MYDIYICKHIYLHVIDFHTFSEPLATWVPLFGGRQIHTFTSFRPGSPADRAAIGSAPDLLKACGAHAVPEPW